MNFLKQSIWTSLASAFYALYTFFLTKFFSTQFGLQGIVDFNHFQNLVSIFSTIPNEGINRGANRYMSGKLHTVVWYDYGWGVVLLNFGSYAVTLLSMLAFGLRFLTSLDVLFRDGWMILFISLGILLHIASLTLVNFILVSGRIAAYALFSIANNLLGIALIVGTYHQDLGRSLLALCYSPSIVLIPMILYIMWINKHCLHLFRWTPSWSVYKHLLHFVWVALSLMVFGRISDFVVREYAISVFSLEDVAMWQAVAKLSDGYSNVFASAFSALIFSKISVLIDDKYVLKAFILKSLIYIFGIGAAGLFLVYLFQETIIILIFDQQFLNCTYLLPMQLLGDLFRFPSMLLSLLILARLQTQSYILSQAFSLAVYLSTMALLLPTFGIEAMVWSHFIRFALYMGIVTFMCRDIFFTTRNKK